MDITSILEKVDSEMFGIWFLIGAALVFFMQCGFAMVETGFTRAKKCGQYYNEKSYGFLHRYSDVYIARLWSYDG